MMKDFRVTDIEQEDVDFAINMSKSMLGDLGLDVTNETLIHILACQVVFLEKNLEKISDKLELIAEKTRNNNDLLNRLQQTLGRGV